MKSLASDLSPLVSYCIPTKNRQKLSYYSALSALEAHADGRIEVNISDNNSLSDSKLQFDFLANQFNQSKLVYTYHELSIPIVDNWLAALELANSEIVKLLFSDDLIVNAPAGVDLLSFLIDSRCAFLSTPAWIGDEENRGINYLLSDKNCLVPCPQFVDGILKYAHLFPHSPCAYYFRKRDIISALRFIRNHKYFQFTLLNGAGIDALSIILILCSGYEYSMFCPAGSVLFRVHEGSITIDDQRSGEGLVDKIRGRCFEYFSTNREELIKQFCDFRSSLFAHSSKAK